MIELRHIVKTYQAGEVDVPVLHDVSLDIRKGEYVALMGASGSGKTTLMNILGFLDHPTAGEYLLEGRDVSTLSAGERAILRGKKIGFVFQSFNLLPRVSALDNVMLPFAYSHEHLPEHEARKRAEQLLDMLSMRDRMHHQPSQLSGGQQQRVAIARALINNPSLVLADEPTGNLDSHTSEEVMAIFREMHQRGLSVVIVTHDAGVARHAERIVRISDGRISSDDRGSADTVGEGDHEA